MSHDQALMGVILAAGKGTRMKSDLPKCLHEVCGVPMAEHVGRALKAGGVDRPIVVVGHGAESLKVALGGCYTYAHQEEQKGTGHATSMAAAALAGFEGPVFVVSGDAPLISAGTLAQLLERHRASRAALTMATCMLIDAKGYGRIVRDSSDKVVRVVEEKDATPSERAIHEVNPAVYCFDCAKLLAVLPTLGSNNAQGEVYLTDAVEALASKGEVVEAVPFDDPDEFLGVNDRWQLAEASRVMRLRILRMHALNGVTIVDPTSTHIGGDVTIETDVVVQPMTVLEGRTTIAAGAEIGPNAWVKDATIGRGCRVFMSHIDQATMEDGSRCGPFSNLRPGAHLGQEVKVGNFVEIKNGRIGAKTSISHLTYIGDAEVGKNTNIGAGTITCNYDGFVKSKTQIGDDVFVGSNSTLIAPVVLGNGSFVAAGSVVTRDVPEDAMAIGRSRQENKESWVKLWRKRRTGQNESTAS